MSRAPFPTRPGLGRLARRALPLAAALALAGCGKSPPTVLLTLDAPPPAPPALRGDYRGPPVALPAVHVPAAIDRAELVRQPRAGEVQADEFARWSAPLGTLARDALVRDLTARLPAGSVLPPGATGAGGRAQVIDVTILALDLRGDGATMQAAWRCLPRGTVRQETLSAPAADASPPGAATALSALLVALADRIVADPTLAACGGVPVAR